MWQPQEDNTYNDLRENSIRQWLEDMSRHEDVAVRGGVKVTAEYLEDLKKQIRQLEEKCALKDAYLKKMKEKAGMPHYWNNNVPAVPSGHNEAHCRLPLPRWSQLLHSVSHRALRF